MGGLEHRGQALGGGVSNGGADVGETEGNTRERREGYREGRWQEWETRVSGEVGRPNLGKEEGRDVGGGETGGQEEQGWGRKVKGESKGDQLGPWPEWAVPPSRESMTIS